MGMSTYIGAPNFIQIGRRTVELWRHINFARWQLKSTSGYVFRDGTRL